MRVAVAGGTGTIGSLIVSALSSSNHTPIILSRYKPDQAITASTTNSSGVETRYVDYTSHTSLVHALHNTEAVISALYAFGDELITTQINLLHAAEQAPNCKRFAPAAFALEARTYPDVEIDHAKQVVWDAARESVKQGKIDAALFPCGIFMNYLGFGAPREKEALAGFTGGPMLFFLGDQRGPRIEVPVVERGVYPVFSTTDIRDLARFVVAALEMVEPWGGRELGMTGNTLGLGEVVTLCERYLGKKVEVKELLVEDLKREVKGLGTGIEDVIRKLDCQYSIVCARGGSVVQPILNNLCPQVKPISVEEYLTSYWMHHSSS